MDSPLSQSPFPPSAQPIQPVGSHTASQQQPPFAQAQAPSLSPATPRQVFAPIQAQSMPVQNQATQPLGAPNDLATHASSPFAQPSRPTDPYSFMDADHQPTTLDPWQQLSTHPDTTAPATLPGQPAMQPSALPQASPATPSWAQPQSAPWMPPAASLNGALSPAQELPNHSSWMSDASPFTPVPQQPLSPNPASFGQVAPLTPPVQSQPSVAGTPVFSNQVDNPFFTQPAISAVQPQMPPLTPAQPTAFTNESVSPFAAQPLPQASAPQQPLVAQEPLNTAAAAPTYAPVTPTHLFSQTPPAIDTQLGSQSSTQTIHQSVLSEIEQEELFGRERLSTWQKVLIVGVAVLTLAIVAGAGVWVYMTITAPAVANAPITGKDTDGDGLSDIEERNYGTNPNNTDTDGDGFSDSDEIKNGYSPLGK